MSEARETGALAARNACTIQIAAACYRHNVPATAGGGMGNDGQAVPLQGGIILDVSRLDAIEWQRPGMPRVGPLIPGATSGL